ncbi:MAG: ATP-dependent DNA helicase, partial [Bryobacteraceae bacterium]
MKTNTRPATAKQFFSPGGFISKWHPQYEFRRGQLEMAQAVESALADRKHLIVEAGTGTGKTLAYLVPAILSGKRVVISTGTKNLQEQLFFKDIPFLQRHFPRPIEVCLMKGRANYACRQKIYDAEKAPVLEGLEENADFEIIREWEKTTQAGDRAEIRTLPESSAAWVKLDARRERCTGKECAQFDRCFITLLQQRAHKSDILIVNHHLFFADLMLKRESEASTGVLPEYHAVVLDEAHEVEDIAGQYFGVAVSSYQFQELGRDAAATARQKNFGSVALDAALAALEQSAMRLFGLLPMSEGRSGFAGRAAFLERNEDAYVDARRRLEILASQLALIEETPEEALLLAGRAQQLSSRLEFVLTSDDPTFVYWLERRGRGCFLQATPIDVAPILAEELFDQVPSVVLTSATLAVGGGFEFVRNRLGVPHARTLLVPGGFDYPRQALLYVPEHLPDPRSPAFAEAASEEIVRLLSHSRGRAFVLFTSYQQMRAVHDRVSLRIDYPALLQGTGPRSALLAEFKRTPNAVLFATSSFWQGVDVPGEQLSCVIVDKLPFAVPSDPIVAARVNAVK